MAAFSLGRLLSGTGMGSIECGELAMSAISFPNTRRASNAEKRDYKWQGESEMSRCAAKLNQGVSLRTQMF